MKSSIRNIHGKIELAKQELLHANIHLESIQKADREANVDLQINRACDAIFEALEALKEIDSYQYTTHVGEKIKVMVHRKTRTKILQK